VTLYLVTGGAGFIGSNLVAALLSGAGVEVAVCDRLRSSASGKWRNLMKRPLHDLFAPDALMDWLDRHGGALEAVIHLGAVSSTMETDVDHIIANNFALSKALFDWCAKEGVRLIYASSAATYGDGAQGFDGFDDPRALAALRPLNPYGWSKALFDRYARSAADAGRAPPQWVGLKFFNVYGPNEGHKGPMRSVVAQIFEKISSGAPVRLFRSHKPAYPDGGQLRDFVYVKDVEEVVAYFLQHPEFSGVFNLGSGRARSFLDLANATFAACGREPEISYVDTPEEIRGAYQYFTEADMSRVRALGFERPFRSLEEGVFDYVTTYLAGADPYR
jgi:ADP-L-glycero-D-manno-heptose 6-epimerase